jgi:hypothetical protein
MKITNVDINAQHIYRIIFREGRYGGAGRGLLVLDFLRTNGLFDEYEPEVSLEETFEDSSEEYSESSSLSSEYPRFSKSRVLRRDCLVGDVRFVIFIGDNGP